jgi:hypothetical protein
MLATTAIAVPARADPPSLSIEVEPCAADADAIDAVRLGEIVSAELSHVGAEITHERANVRVAVALVCDEGTVMARLDVLDTLTAKRVGRDVALSEMPERLWERGLAIAIGELVRASWVELVSIEPGPAEPPVIATVRDAAIERIAPIVARRLAPSRDRATYALRFGIDGRWVDRFDQGFAGVVAGLEIAPAEVPLSATLAIGAAFSSESLDLGALVLAHAFADAAIFLEGRLAPVVLGAGLFARTGPLFVIASADAPAAAHDGVLASLTGGVRIAARWTFAGEYVLALEIDAGAPLVAAEIESLAVPVAGIDGLTIGAGLTLAVPL